MPAQATTRPTIAWPTVRALLVELSICAFSVVGAMLYFRWWTVVPAMLVIATRQHALSLSSTTARSTHSSRVGVG